MCPVCCAETAPLECGAWRGREGGREGEREREGEEEREREKGRGREGKGEKYVHY